MPRSFKATIRDPRVTVRIILGLFVAANLAAAVLAFKPFGGSGSDLRRQKEDLQMQLTRLQARLAATRKMADKVSTARKQGDDFLTEYVTDRRTTYSTVFEELNRISQQAGIKAREQTVELNPIEGSDTLEMMSITAGYEGPAASLDKFVSLIDKSQRFLIIESITASPEQGGQLLNVNVKLDTFVKNAAGPSS
jgi:type IV pilus assembly protein PilO